MYKRLLIVSAFLLTGLQGFAQEMYLSISGSNVGVLSGDSRHQYDIWIKPEGSATTGSVQIFDAGLGGAVDLITNENANTVTTYQLYRFEDLYSENGNSVIRRTTNPSPVAEIVAKNEERFKNRWVPLADLLGSSKGYIVRVSSDDGDDVNSYNLRVASQSGQVLSGTDWKIIAIDLSIGVFRTEKNTQFQLRPYQPAEPGTEPSLQVNGEEDSKVRLIDSFGDRYPVDGAAIDDSRYGIKNVWGLEVTGSTDWLNTFTVYGKGSPVLWEFQPIVLSESQKPQLTITETEATECAAKSFELSGSAFNPGDLRQAIWMMNGVRISTGNAPTIGFEDRGRLNIDVLIPNMRSYFPEFWSYSKEVFINTSPVVELEAPKKILSPSEPLTLSAEGSYDPEGQQVYYTWFVNGTRRGTGPTFKFSNTVSGSYNISVQVSDGGSNLSCSNSQSDVQIRVNTQPYAEISVRPVSGTDDPITLKAINVSDSDNDQLSYLWEGIGIPANSTGDSVTVSHAQPGVYPVRLTINDGSGAQNARFSVNKVYEINAAPIPDFSVPVNVAPGDVFTLNGVESMDPNQDRLSYRWLVNGNNYSTDQITTISLDSPGTYRITLEVNDMRNASNSIQQITKSVHVNAAPTPVITAASMSSGANVEFEAGSSFDSENQLESYNWDFGDGNFAFGPRVSHTYQRTGEYTVRLTVDDGSQLANSIQSTEHTIVINSYPTASFEAPDVVAPGEPFTVDGSASTDPEGTISAYNWMANGNPVGNGSTTSITLNKPGLHTVGLTVTDNSGFDEAKGFQSKLVRVNQPPVAIWRTEPTHPVPGQEVKIIADGSFDPDGSIDRYQWVFEDGTAIRGLQIQRVFQEGGPKKFTLAVTDNDDLSNSTTTVEGVIQVNNQPYIVTEPIVRSNSVHVRLDASESYDLDNDALTFEWTLPDGTKRREASFTWTAQEPGVHFIGLTVNDGQGLENSKNSESVQVMVNRPVQAVVDSVITSCTGQTVLFNSSRSYDPDGDPFKVQWNFGNGQTSDEANPTFVYDQPGVYEATVTLDDGFSRQRATAKIPVIIEGSPVARLNVSETTVCVNSAITFDGSQSSDPSGSLPSLSWDLGDGNSATGAITKHTFVEPGTYTVTLTVEGSGSGQCSNVSQATATITVVEGPEAAFDLPDWAAPGEPVMLDGSASNAVGGFKSAKWLIETASETKEIEGLTTTHTFETPGEYMVTLLLQTNTDTECNTVSLTRSIKVNAKPEIVWTLPEMIAAGGDLKLDALESSDEDGYIKQFKWYIDDGFVSYNASELVKAIAPGRHKVTLEIRDNSNASNNFVSQEKYFFANSSPKPTIQAPGVVYQNQTVALRSGLAQDADGDLVTTKWKLDGAPLPSPSFVASEAKTYVVTLIQDDGRGLENSVDSTVMEINPVKIPEVHPVYPKQIVAGGILSLDELNVTNEWFFANNTVLESTWRAQGSGLRTFNLAWAPQGRELARKDFNITVFEPLNFTKQPTPTTISWNPANPITILTAPAVNRDPSDVEYIWKKSGKEIGRGMQISSQLNKGLNKYTIEVYDLNVAQSKPITVDLIITAE
tara:strand:+ start:54277 stop:58992 length:4716 start_codon:yes stop_codon:yes gene_type:complete